MSSKSAENRLFDVDVKLPWEWYQPSAVKNIASQVQVSVLRQCNENDWPGSTVSLPPAPPCVNAPQYIITDDRGPSAIDTPSAKPLLKDMDPKDDLLINDLFTPPLNGYPVPLPAKEKADHHWSCAYVAALGKPSGERERALAEFQQQFLAEAVSFACVLVRKVALCEMHADTGTPLVTCKYQSASSALLHQERRPTYEVLREGRCVSGRIRSLVTTYCLLC